MATYCLEISAASGKVLHLQNCLMLDIATLIGEGRIVNIGAHNNAEDALNSVISHLCQVVLCAHCCPVIQKDNEGTKMATKSNLLRCNEPLGVVLDKTRVLKVAEMLWAKTAKQHN